MRAGEEGGGTFFYQKKTRCLRIASSRKAMIIGLKRNPREVTEEHLGLDVDRPFPIRNDPVEKKYKTLERGRVISRGVF